MGISHVEANGLAGQWQRNHYEGAPTRTSGASSCQAPHHSIIMYFINHLLRLRKDVLDDLLVLSLNACQHVISGDVWLSNFSQRHRVNILLREHCSAVQYFLVTTRSEISQDRTKLWWKLSLNQMDPYRQLEESKLNMLNKVPTGRFFLCYTNSIWWPWIFLNRLMYVVLVVDVIFMYFVTDWNIVV